VGAVKKGGERIFGVGGLKLRMAALRPPGITPIAFAPAALVVSELSRAQVSQRPALLPLVE